MKCQECGDAVEVWHHITLCDRCLSTAHFYVYAITFDQDTFGIFSTRERAEESLAKQIAEGGPAWDACKVERWRVNGHPEVSDD